MNTSTAKQIPIVELLTRLNLQPKKQGRDFWYISPFHNEKTPSFKVDTVKNLWYDHSIGIGGNIIDLTMKLFAVDVSSALKRLEDIFQNSFSFHQQTISPGQTIQTDKKIEIKKIQTLQNKALIEYLSSRKIDIAIAKKYLKELYWINPNTNKSNFGFGFKNNAGGWEVRNRLIKLNLGGKDVTYIKGMDSNKISIFEGFLDFLSALIYFKVEKFTGDVLILNSIVLKDRALEFLNDKKAVYCFLDNDASGRATLIYFASRYKVIDCSKYYKNYKDFNDFIRR